MSHVRARIRLMAAAAAWLAFGSQPVIANEGLPPAVQAKAEAYKKKLAEWAAHPVIVAAVKDANAGGPPAGLSNGKWNDLDEKDPVVKGYETSRAGQQVRQWEADPVINKLVVRDAKGNLVAASTKPLVFNNATRPAFANPVKGQPWAAGEIRPDPTTGIKSVQAGAPVLDGGKVIGVIHAGITAD